ncbi:MAG: bifunctional methylenetetrahydrofolate dehydrogenase/methenyltetrahydrofolate cyclohydrolase FolD [Oscillospiraceae bacterium]|nr:bifunctional methylenetetrahydrofolate dehydrogenase/methenyltetrahydrofolate cyclohydrolase FolD [Oscillospiraceae bacterium]
MAILLDGKAIAAKHKKEIAKIVGGMARKPGLAIVLVGDDPASQVYVKWKIRDCEECGITPHAHYLPAATTTEELLALIAKLNADSAVDGILCQLPLPKHIDEAAVLQAIDPRKDVDCFHPENVGLFMIGRPRFWPGTPAGVMLLLEEYGIDIAGKECVVVGRSNIVGKPQAMLLLQKHGTVTVAHSRTKDLAEVTRRADILVAAVGVLHLITADMVKPGAVVIDVGMNKTSDGKLAGDVDFEGVEKVASYITPVPGGVGPMTRVMLMKHTLAAAGRL